MKILLDGYVCYELEAQGGDDQDMGNEDAVEEEKICDVEEDGEECPGCPAWHGYLDTDLSPGLALIGGDLNPRLPSTRSQEP